MARLGPFMDPAWAISTPGDARSWPAPLVGGGAGATRLSSYWRLYGAAHPLGVRPGAAG
eukprot:CAMPEP_0194289450 /NCGR_PEP_ID=MMETSP0169-20130528/39071_1 /TAXON_ID=218684 /ORGANISM="Corethron pennatum, Strain L29A3" /LENGTH=58 /DNA_ID=CAMNT_0039036731 /DNA_START=25 /DNA_END=197 /DNA_ORIENTATION=-